VKDTEKASEEDFNLDDLKRYMSLSAEEKLNYLEAMNIFLMESMPDESKKAWEELKKRGW
jgi:hypothetical protein